MGKKLAATAIVLGVMAAFAIAIYHLQYNPLESGVVADRVLLEKGARRITIFKNDQPLKTYRVALGRTPIGKKEFEGDGKTPEGGYTIDYHKEDSSFHQALHISYPNSTDMAFAEEKGQSAGSLIMIHGIRNGLGLVGPIHRVADWTEGCVAVTNAEIRELWRAVPDGTPIEIVP